MSSNKVPIDPIAFVGKSWYRRGPAYWCARVLAVIFLLLMTAMIFAIAIGITIGIVQAGGPAWIVVPIVVLLSVGSSIKYGQTIVRKQREQTANEDGLPSREIDREARQERAHRRRLTAGTGALGYAASALGGMGTFVVAICVPIAVGVFPVTLWYWLQPLAPGELRARRKVAHWLTVMGRKEDIPASWKLV
jgi:hypothetical protein